MQNLSELALTLRTAIEASNNSVDDLADRTKVPRTTILALIEEPIAAVLPERVYLRGHLKVLAKAIQLDPTEMARLFDEAYPVAKPYEAGPSPSLPGRNIAFSAGLYGIAFIAVAAAFATVLS